MYFPNQFSFPPGYTERLHFPTFFVVMGPLWLSSDQWSMGRSNVFLASKISCQIFCSHFLFHPPMECQCSRWLWTPHAEDAEPWPAKPFSLFPISCWSAWAGTQYIRAYLLLQLAVSLSTHIQNFIQPLYTQCIHLHIFIQDFAHISESSCSIPRPPPTPPEPLSSFMWLQVRSYCLEEPDPSVVTGGGEIVSESNFPASLDQSGSEDSF